MGGKGSTSIFNHSRDRKQVYSNMGYNIVLGCHSIGQPLLALMPLQIGACMYILIIIGLEVTLKMHWVPFQPCQNLHQDSDHFTV